MSVNQNYSLKNIFEIIDTVTSVEFQEFLRV